MLPRRRFHPEGHLSIGIPLTHSHALACGEMIFLGGQADISGAATVTHPHDIVAQTRIAMEGIARVLAGIGADTGDLVKLTGFYVLGDAPDEGVILATIAEALGVSGSPGPCITLVPIETNCFTGLSIEIEGIAMRGQNGERLARSAAWIPDGAALPPAFAQALKVGRMLFTSGQVADAADGRMLHPGSLTQQSHVVMGKLRRLLGLLGADLGDAVKANVFNVEPGRQEDWKEAALARAAYYPEPGPAATGISLPRLSHPEAMIRCDVIAMRGEDGARLPRRAFWPDGHWDWPVHLPYRHGLLVGDLLWIGGQVALTPDAKVIAPGDIAAQTATAMEMIGRVLAEAGMDFRHLVKINTFYTGTNGQEDLLRNASVRAGYYRPPGPASTGIPFPWLAYEDMLIEIDCVAMV